MSCPTPVHPRHELLWEGLRAPTENPALSERRLAPRLTLSLRYACLAAASLMVWAASHAHAGDAAFKIVDAAGAPVAHAVVSLHPLDAPPAASAAAAPVVEIVQDKLEFSPYVTAVQVGAAVRLPNRDSVEHHVYSESPAKKLEFPLYAPGKAETVVFDRPGVVVLGCNIHDWMLAYVVVLPTPWFAVTGADGAATVSNAPAGRYRAEVWHPRLAKVATSSVSLPVASATPFNFSLTLRKDQRVRRPIDAGGKGYR